MTEAIEARIEKLLRMADGTANENESSVALHMAQKLADAHNLDLNVIGKSGTRKDEKVSKGLYQYQRTLYSEIADINHCKVWISKGIRHGSKYEIRLLGSKVNVAMVRRTCDYVEDVANRLVRENMSHVNFFSKAAHHYREGVIDRLIVRIKELRAAEEKERERQKREQEARMRRPGVTAENAIVLISDVAEAEKRANYDYENGEGAYDAMKAWARAQEEAYRERRAKALAEAEEFERNHPELAAQKKREQEEANEKYWAEARKRSERLDKAAERRRQERIDKFGYDPQDYKTRKATKYDSAEYHMGSHHGESVSLNDQIDEQKRKGLT